MPHINQLLRSTGYTQALNSGEWRNFSQNMRSQKGNACEMCKRADVQLQVHHPFYDPARQLWDYASDEVVVLCDGCHKAMHTQLQMFRKFVFSKMNPQVLQTLNGALAVAFDKYDPLIFAHAVAELASTPSMVARYAAAWNLPPTKAESRPYSPNDPYRHTQVELKRLETEEKKK